MATVHILIFGEMAGFKIVPFIAPHVKMKYLWPVIVHFVFLAEKRNVIPQNNLISVIYMQIGEF